MKGKATIPEKVYVIGEGLDPTLHHTPIIGPDGSGFAPLTVLDADDERALPVFTTLEKAEQGIRHYEVHDLAGGPVGIVGVEQEGFLRALQESPPEAPRADYVGINMGEGGVYPLIRL
jgi:hypothetical protein